MITISNELTMIESFRSKGLREAFLTGSSRRLPSERVEKIKKILAVINAATQLQDLRLPAFRLHTLKDPPLKGYLSIDVSGNYRIVFRFENGNAYDVDYLDTH